MSVHAGIYENLIEDLSARTEYLREDLHDLFRKMFLKPISKTILGRNIISFKRVEDMDESEFSDYVEKIRTFLSDFGIELSTNK